MANNLNDIAKDHPSLVLSLCEAWIEDAPAGRAWIVKHALRSLIKEGDRRALAVVGLAAPKKLRARLRARPSEVAVGESVELVAELETAAARAQELLIDYVVHYVRKGNKTSGKVFKWKTLALPARASLVLHKRHAMRKTTIRALYPGRHRVELQINGVRAAQASFRLV